MKNIGRYSSKNDNLKVILPFKEDGIDKANVIDLLNNAGLGLPDYYEWRSKNGCTFCFQQNRVGAPEASSGEALRSKKIRKDLHRGWVTFYLE